MQIDFTIGNRADSEYKHSLCRVKIPCYSLDCTFGGALLTLDMSLEKQKMTRRNSRLCWLPAGPLSPSTPHHPQCSLCLRTIQYGVSLMPSTVFKWFNIFLFYVAKGFLIFYFNLVSWLHLYHQWPFHRVPWNKADTLFHV